MSLEPSSLILWQKKNKVKVRERELEERGEREDGREGRKQNDPL